MEILVLTTYPPRFCGIGTYAHNLVTHLRNLNTIKIQVIAINDSKNREIHQYGEEVQWVMDQSIPSSYLETAKYINYSPYELLHIQHEFGIFGGVKNFSILELVKALSKPYMVTFHSTPPEPEDWEREILEGLYRRAEKVVVQSRTARRLLIENYGFSPDKISCIPHGIPDVELADSESLKRELGLEGKKIILTFGLLTPRKGIENVFPALSILKEEIPNLYYLIMGRPHPRWEITEGKTFSEHLMEKAKEQNVNSRVIIKSEFLEEGKMLKYIQAADIVLTTYSKTARKQVVSGVLSYAMGCGKAIISTPYLHAEELLSEGRGILVEFDNASALAENIKRVLENPQMKRESEKRAYNFSRSFRWSVVAEDYLRLYQSLIK
ncbi:MAG TPA: glycosyltransferase [Candidatus Omnitrophica bacterium]|nr:glycosyltransferase [Candidatus Omnitrophota bacterium]